MTCGSAVLRYLSSHELGCCSLLAGSSFVVFMTLLPMVIDPSVLTFVLRLEPASCLTVYTASLSGTSNCSWSSCQQGCTVDIFKCYHVNVSYVLTDPVQAARLMDQQIQTDRSLLDDDNRLGDGRGGSGTAAAAVNELSPYQLPRQPPARLYPNVVGCGYPPEVDCEQFFHDYGRQVAFERVFPCFISMTDPTVAVISADLSDAAWRLAVGFSPLLICLTLAVYVSLRLRCRRRRRAAARLKGQTAIDLVEEQARRIAESKRLLESRKQMWLQAFRQDRSVAGVSTSLAPPSANPHRAAATKKKQSSPLPPAVVTTTTSASQQQHQQNQFQRDERGGRGGEEEEEEEVEPSPVAGPSRRRSRSYSPAMPTSLPAPLVATISATIHSPAVTNQNAESSESSHAPSSSSPPLSPDPHHSRPDPSLLSVDTS